MSLEFLLFRVSMQGCNEIKYPISQSPISIPLHVDMIQKTAGLVNEGRIEGISEIRDESDRKGMRIVYEIKRDAIPNVVLNKLYKYTNATII